MLDKRQQTEFKILFKGYKDKSLSETQSKDFAAYVTIAQALHTKQTSPTESLQYNEQEDYMFFIMQGFYSLPEFNPDLANNDTDDDDIHLIR